MGTPGGKRGKKAVFEIAPKGEGERKQIGAMIIWLKREVQNLPLGCVTRPGREEKERRKKPLWKEIATHEKGKKSIGDKKRT